MTTALEPGEVLVAVHLPRPDPATQFRYRKILHPASGYAVVGVAVALRLHDSVVAEASIAITGATGRAFAADAASAHLIGKPLTLENIASAAQLASEQASACPTITRRPTIASTSSGPRSAGRWRRWSAA